MDQRELRLKASTMLKPSVSVWLTVAVILVIRSTGVHAADPDEEGTGAGPFDLNELTEELMTPVFRRMKKMGETMRDEITGKWTNVPEGTKVKQFLLVAVLSRSELELVSSSTEFPDDFKVKTGENSASEYVTEMSRMVFLMNQPSAGNKETYNIFGDTKHTEVAAIDGEYIDRLKYRFETEYNKGKYPLILMYSHYIPCYGAKDTHYSCAQEIKNYAHNRHTEFGFIVAFTDLFPGIKETCPREQLREGGVLLFKYRDNDEEYERIEDFNPPRTQEQEAKRTLQGDLYGAFIIALPKKSPCCIGDAENKKQIMAFFINEMTYTCTHDRPHKSRVTKYNKNSLGQCMGSFIIDAIGNECSKNCTRGKLSGKLKHKLCTILKSAAENQLSLGQPPSSNDKSIYNPIWTPYDGAFQYLYTGRPSEKARALPPVMCADRRLSTISLCTKKEDKAKQFGVNIIDQGSEFVGEQDQETQEPAIDRDMHKKPTVSQNCECTQ